MGGGGGEKERRKVRGRGERGETEWIRGERGGWKGKGRWWKEDRR